MSTTSPLIGITAEWNPFHTGHSAMIDLIKKAYPKASLMAIMSGAFVQRGEPALFDKWTRARWAIRSGVDAVFEFPALYALQSADRFSCHAASMLHAMGANMIAFGAESLTKDELISAARWAISEDYEHLLHEKLQAASLTEKLPMKRWQPLSRILPTSLRSRIIFWDSATRRRSFEGTMTWTSSSFPATRSIPSPRRMRGVNSCLKKGRLFFLLRTPRKPLGSWKKATTQIPPAMKTAVCSSPA